MLVHAYLLTHLKHRASRATREPACADMFAERYKKAIDLYPVLARQFFNERFHSLLGRASLNVAPAICHAMNMYVNSDVRLATGDTKHKVGALGADALKRKQHIGVARQMAIVFFDYAASDFHESVALCFHEKLMGELSRQSLPA